MSTPAVQTHHHRRGHKYSGHIAHSGLGTDFDDERQAAMIKDVNYRELGTDFDDERQAAMIKDANYRED